MAINVGSYQLEIGMEIGLIQEEFIGQIIWAQLGRGLGLRRAGFQIMVHIVLIK